MHTVLQRLSDDAHLFYRLGEIGGESVLVRSFAVLQIAAILERHLSHPFLTVTELHALLPLLPRYLEAEKDLRGYDGSLGWLHTAAYTADAMSNLTCCSELGSADLHQVLRGAAVPSGL